MTQPAQTNPCTFWIHHSEGADRLKQGAATLVFALATIALLGGTLAILAQQGFPLGGINSLAQQIGTQATYLAMVGIGAVWISSIVLLAALAHSHKKEQFSDAELQTHGVLTPLNNLNIQLKISRKQYWSETFDASTGHSPSVFGLFTKDVQGQIHRFAYRTANQREAHTRYHLSEYTDGKALFEKSPEYPASFGATLIPNNQLKVPQRGTYVLQHDLFLHVLSIGTPRGTEVHYCKTEERVKELLTQFYPAYLSDEEIQDAITRKQPPHLGEANYWPRETTIGDNIPLYLLYTQDQVLYWTNKQERIAYINTNLTDFTNRGLAFSKNLENYTQTIYQTHPLQDLLEENDLYQGVVEIDRIICHFLIGHNGHYQYATNPITPPTGFQVTIVEDVDQINSPLDDQLEEEVFKEMEKQKQWFDDNSYTCIDHEKLFSVVFNRDGDGDTHSLTFTSKETRVSFVQKSLTDLNEAAPYEYLFNKLIEENFLEYLPKNTYQFVKITYRKADIPQFIYVDDEGELYTSDSKPNDMKSFAEYMELTNGRLPQELGEVLAEKTSLPPSTLEEYQPRLFKGEFWNFNRKKTGVYFFQEIYPLLVRGNDDQIDTLYFLTADERAKYRRSHFKGFANGYSRHKKILAKIFGESDVPGTLHPPSDRGSIRTTTKTFEDNPKVNLKCWYDVDKQRKWKYTRV
ncbi:MAG: hypothetical protein K940chlam9_00357 [Chlamydiae bacterium]|nr:hypothetical protein [Chlamydiota bacterium]